MASMNWTWEQFWNWFDQIETENDEGKLKGKMLNHFLDIKWLGGLTIDSQVEVMEFASLDVMKQLKVKFPTCLKSETVSILNEILKDRYKPTSRRRKRK